MVKRPLRKTNRTVLIVVEGETELAFVTHLKNVYYRRGMRLSVNIKNAHGYGPQGVIDKLKTASLNADFDHRIAVLDSDIPLKASETKWLKQEKIALITSCPSIEGTLLEILGKHVPQATPACKTALQGHAPGNKTESRYYQKYFPFEQLERGRHQTPVLAALIAAVSTE